MALLVWAALTLLLYHGVKGMEANFDGVQPIIHQVFPTSGSIMGGTALRIYGFNFAPSGFFAQMVVYVGVEECNVVPYYTSNDQIYCITPPCTSDGCLLRKSSFSVTEKVDVSVHVATVAGILSDYSHYTYASSMTPTVTSLTRNVWATCSASISGTFDTTLLKNIDVKFDEYHASLGTNEELNSDDLSWHAKTNQKQVINYRPVSDMRAGFYNMSITLSNADMTIPTLDNGLATFFPNYFTRSQYTTTQSGIPYNTALYPVVTSVSPSTGSIAGGTTVTISGHGFSSDMSDLTVLVGGVNCDVTTASMNEITCVTNPIEKSGTTQSVLAAFSTTEPYSSLELSNGSPGAWVSLGNGVSFALREGLSLTLYDSIGETWPEALNYSSLNSDPMHFRADIGFIFTAPYSGSYKFLSQSTDASSVYVSTTAYFINETRILNGGYTSQNFYQNANQKSSAIALSKGDKLYMRANVVNYGSYDEFLLATQITLSAPIATVQNDTAAMYSTLREVQQIAFSFAYQREVQQVRIVGASSGVYQLIIQGSTVTSSLSLNSTNNDISKAMSAAVGKLPSEAIECRSFSVASTWVVATLSLTLNIQFECDSRTPYTLLQVFDAPLNPNPTTTVTRTQAHTAFPSGTFDLTLLGTTVFPLIPIDVEASTLEDMINADSDNLYVAVSRSRSFFTGFLYTITYASPRSDVPQLSVDSSLVSGDSFAISVTSPVNGDAQTLFFSPIPIWMTDMPVKWSSNMSTGSIVQVVQKTGVDAMKAICDGSGVSLPGAVGLVKGDDSACSFKYLAASTPSVTAYSLSTAVNLGIPTHTISLVGKGFLLGSGIVTIALGDVKCVTAAVVDTSLTCVMSGVPWGSYIPVISVSGVGNAVHYTSDTLTFTQAVNSISPLVSSFAGGQSIVISGYGFRSSAQVLLFDSSPCTVEAATVFQIICVTPKVPEANFTNSVLVSTDVNVDGVSGGSLDYTATSTPVITSLSSYLLSSAADVTLNFTGSGFTSGSPIVHIGELLCPILESSDTFVSCFLSRSSLPAATSTSDVHLYVFGKGYGGNSTALNTVPSVIRGYEVLSITPDFGSVYGGTYLHLSGVGFVSGTSITFSDSVSSSAYAKLILALGIAYSNVTTHVQTCTIISQSFFDIECIVDRLAVPLSTNNTIVASVVVSDILPYVSNDEILQVVQADSSTPSVTSINGFARNALGVSSFTLSGSLLYYAGSITDVTVGGVACTTSGSSVASLLVVSCDALTAGQLPISVQVRSLGFARVHPSVFVDVNLASTSGAIDPSFATVGSAMGGSLYSINGLGFSTICSENSISFVLSDGKTIDASSLLLTCTNSKLSGLTPSVGYDASVDQIVMTTGSKTSVFSSFSFMFSHVATPKVQSFTYAGNTLSMTLSSPYSLAAYSATPVVSLAKSGGISCSSITNTSDLATFISVDFVCAVPPLPAGNYSVFANIPPLGNAAALTAALKLPFLTVLLSLDVFGAQSSSALGGLDVSVSGVGLSSTLALLIDGKTSPYALADSTSLSFATPPLRTTAFVDYLDANGISIDMIETVDIADSSIAASFSSNPSATSAAFDNLYSTSFFHNNANCFIGVSMVGSHRIQPYRMRFYTKFQTAARISTVYFEGSTNGGATYVQIGNHTKAHEGWNFIDASSSSLWFTHLRYKVSDTTVLSQCALSEVKFLGVIATTQLSLPVTMYDSTFGVSYPLGNISYADTSRTPLVMVIAPKSGTSLGGTVVTLTGVYGSTVVPPTVVLNGIACAVQSWDTTSITCITGYRGPDNIQTGSVLVNIPGYGDSISGDDVLFTYMDRWSDVRSWRNRRLPVDGDFVWIPAGQSIILDQDTPNLLFLLVQGALYLDSTVAHIAIDSKYIFVYGGLFEIGTESNPYESAVTITLHGDRFKDIDVPEIGVKCIAVASLGMPKNNENSGVHLPGRNVGQLEIHGKKRLRTWTKLASTALAGSSTIVTSERVDFAPGDKLVLSGTQLEGNADFSIDEVIVKTSDGFTITLEQPLKYTHQSDIMTFAGRSVDMRGAVGLLSRNIVIQGDENSQGQLFGVHMVARMSGIFRVENAELTRCGQAFILGRYCTHSHKAGNMLGSYVKANSIHHGFQRAVTTHDTFYWEVRDNVAYNIMGHTYFFEDGTEKYNEMSGNLGIRTKACSACLASDTSPAVFWTATPSNFWWDNYGANSDSFGFWFEFSGRPSNFIADGDFDVCPAHEPLGAFTNNTLVANAAIGYRIYPIYVPYVNPCDGSSGNSPQYFRDLVSFRNGEGFFNKMGGDLHHIDYTLVANSGDGMNIVKFVTNELKNDPNVVGAVIVGSADSAFNINTDLGGKNAIRLPQHEYFYVKDITVVNYGKSAAFSGCNECDNGNEFNQGGFTTRFENIKFEKSGRRIGWTPHFKEIFWDLDGTLTGQVGGMVTKNYLFNHFPGCVVADPSIYDDSVICDGTNKIRRLALDYFAPYTLAWNALSIVSSAGKHRIPFLPLDIYGWVMPVVDNHEYTLEWETSGQSAQSFSLRLSTDQYLNQTYVAGTNESIMVSYTSYSYDYLAYSYVNTLYGKTSWAPRDATVSLNDRMGASAYNTTSRELDIVLSTNGADFSKGLDVCKISTQARLCPPEGCPLPSKYKFAQYTMWTNTSAWAYRGGTPTVGQTVIIPDNLWIVMDIVPPRLGCIVVYGKLSFLSGSGVDLILHTQCIQVFGVLEINGYITPSGYDEDNVEFNGKATISLVGTKEEAVPLVMGEGLFIGSKHIGVAGVFSAKGKTRTSYQAKLSTTAALGSTSISVVSPLPLGWVVGDEIVVSATGYFNEAGKLWSDDSAPGNEKRTVTSISSVAQGSGLLSTIGFSAPLQQTHLCTTVLAESFCASVGLLTRSVRIVSEDITGTSDGFGGHISVVDVIGASGDAADVFIGSIDLDSVELRNIGKVNTNYFGVGFIYRYRSVPAPVSRITNCAFVDGFNFAVHATNMGASVITGNVMYKVIGGGIYIDRTCTGVTVSNNLALSLSQIPSLYLNGYFWVIPIASFTFNSFTGVYKNNLAAGSFDTGFSVATSVFSGYNGAATPTPLNTAIVSRNLCAITQGSEKSVDVSGVLASRLFADNEAVGCRVGLMVVNDDRDESTSDTCAFVSGFKAWRNAHIGIGGVDAIANTLLSNVVVAENHIGISFSYFRTAANGFSGVANSKVIGTLSSSKCVASAGTTWTVQKCQAFSQNDPFGLSKNCMSVLGALAYTRVGILVPQSTNGAKTCKLAGRFQEGTCNPSLTPDRLCGMPWEKRYGLPGGQLYAEFHVFSTVFSGFADDSSCKSSYGAAVAINPSQIDKQPVIVSSAIDWSGEGSGLMDMKSRLSTSVQGYECGSSDCMGHHSLLIHDRRGFLMRSADAYLPDPTARNNIAGQILFDNPTYVSPSCFSASNLGSSLYTCLSGSFKQYSGLWLNIAEMSDNVVAGPIIVNRYLSDVTSTTRDFAQFGAKPDLCPIIMPGNRFDILIAPGHYHKMRTTGTEPYSRLIRWDSPYSSDSAVIDFFIVGSYVLNVLVASSPDGPFRYVPNQFTPPTLSDPAGSNYRNPQARSLMVTIRGGSEKYYVMRFTPIISVTVRMQMSMADFFSNTFVANIALLLSISINRIAIVSVRAGSVITSFTIGPVEPIAYSEAQFSSQVLDLQTLAQNITAENLALALGVVVLDLSVEAPGTPTMNATIVQPTYEPEKKDMTETVIISTVASFFAAVLLGTLTYFWYNHRCNNWRKAHTDEFGTLDFDAGHSIVIRNEEDTTFL